jgi:hypothetical protein
LPPVDLDAEFDANEFLFGEGADAAETTAEAEPAETPEAVVPASTNGAAAAIPAAEAPPDPLIPIKAMSPEERIALFS